MHKIFLIILGIATVALISSPPSASAIDCSRADIDGGGVSTSDLLLIENNFTTSSNPYDETYDVNEDGTVDSRDVTAAQHCYGSNPNAPIPPPVLPESSVDGFTPETFITDLISAILPIILGIAGFITVIFIIISGIQFMTSSGNPEAAGAARGRLTFAIIGFVIIILAFAITQIVARIFLGETGVF